MNRAVHLALALVLVALVGFYGWRTLRPPSWSEDSGNGGAEQVDSLPAPEAPAVSSIMHLPSGRVLPPDRVSSLLSQLEQTLRTNEDAGREEILAELVPALLAQDRAAAALLVENLPVGPLRAQLLRHLARAWAAADFGGAVAWIASLSDATDRKTAFADACFEVAQTKAAEAIQAWESFAFTADDQVLENLVQTWAEQDMPAAVEWTARTAPGRQRDQAVARIAYVMARSRPREAAAFVTRELPPGPEQTEAVISVLHQWAGHDRAAAVAWVERFPPGPLADRAQSELEGMAQHTTVTPRR